MRRASQSKPRVSEAGFQLLLAEIIRKYSSELDPSANEAKLENAKKRVEDIGFQVGSRLIERLTDDKERFAVYLDVIKFLCKDVWTEIFGKQVDNLRTNHKGTFVLRDDAFPWIIPLAENDPAVEAAPGPDVAGYPIYISRSSFQEESNESLNDTSQAKAQPGFQEILRDYQLSPPPESGGSMHLTTVSSTSISYTLFAKEHYLWSEPRPSSCLLNLFRMRQGNMDEDSSTTEDDQSSREQLSGPLSMKKIMTDIYLCFPSGIIRGGLCNLGVQCTVTPQVLSGHSCQFTIKTQKPSLASRGVLGAEAP